MTQAGITIYVEGGGPNQAGRTRLRNGMDEFLKELKDLARKKRMGWNTVFCGGRVETYNRFINATRRPKDGEIIFLLVDAEDPVKTDSTKSQHLNARTGDNFNLSGFDEARIQLMVTTMESWIAADPEALKEFYGKDFKENALPRSTELESIPRDRIAAALAAATKDTSKGSYHKIHHAAELLKKISPLTVQDRCPACKQLFADIRKSLIAK